MKFFVSYSNADRNWAEWIAWQLESAGHSAVIQAWDFHPGENFVVDMQQAAAGTDHTIAVLSDDYLASAFCSPEWAAAFARDPTGAQRILIPVRVRPCNLTGLLSQVVFIDLTGLELTAARNTLLNGIAAGRAKPVLPPTFPGGGANEGKAPVFPGSQPAPPFTGGTGTGAAAARSEETAEAIHVSIQCPETILGVDSMPIHFRFRAEAPGMGARVVFTQNEFVICDPAGAIADEFSFQFPGAEVYDRVLQIRAKESKDSNHVVSILCEDERGNVLSRNSYIIRVTEPPFWWRFAEGLRAMLAWGFGGGLGRLAVLLILLVAGGLYLAMWTPVGRAITSRFSAPLPVDLLRPYKGDKWGDSFSDEAKTRTLWRLDRGAHFPSGARNLEIDGPAAVYTQDGVGRGAFFNFDMSFTATILKGGTLEWLVRAWPVPPLGAGPRRAYWFILSAAKAAGGGVQYDLKVKDCAGSGLSKCQDLDAVPADWFDSCDQPRQLLFIMRVFGPKITIAGEAIGLNEAGCHPNTPFHVRHFTGTGTGDESRYGAVGFRVPDAGEQAALQLVSIHSLDQSTENYFASRSW